MRGRGCRVWGVGCRVWAIACAAWGGGSWAQKGAPPLHPSPSTLHPPAAEKIGEHRYRIGRVLVDTAEKIVRVPCRVNMHRGMIEFMAVASEGKLHESVLLAEAEPLHIHLALLLLGLEPGQGARYHGDLETPSGPGVEARVEWKAPAPASVRGPSAVSPPTPAAGPL